MSVEYRDGSFSENLPISEALEKFSKAFDDGTARALHVGTERELNEIKKKKILESHVTELEERLKAVEKGPVKSENVVIPTRDEIIHVLREKNLNSC